MTITYSIAEARDKFAAIVHEAEATDQPVQVTRRGQPVAVILSQEKYERLLQDEPTKPDFWTAYMQWRKEWNVDELDLDPDEIWGDVRDRTGKRGQSWL